MSVGLCTAVSFNEPQTISQKLLGFADSYLSLGCLGCKRVEVISGFAKDGKEGVINDSSPSSCLFTALKIVSYLTVILPLLALITKIALRSTHSFYLLDDKQQAELVLKKVEARKPLSNEDLKFLPLSRLNHDQFNSIFNLDVLPAELPKLRERFACIPAPEVRDAVYKGVISENEYMLISENQCKALNIAQFPKVYDAIINSSVNVENLQADLSLKKCKVPDLSGIFERVKSKIANLDPTDLENALLDFAIDDDIYHFLSDQQLEKLKISRFDKFKIIKLHTGLCGRPQLFFGQLTQQVILDTLPARRRRFALLDISEVRQAVTDGKIDFYAIADLASDAQFQALEFSKLMLQNLFFMTFSNEAEAYRHFKLIPQEEIKKAIDEGRLSQDLADSYKS